MDSCVNELSPQRRRDFRMHWAFLLIARATRCRELSLEWQTLDPGNIDVRTSLLELKSVYSRPGNHTCKIRNHTPDPSRLRGVDQLA